MAFTRLATLVADALQLLVDREALRDARQVRVQRLQPLERHGRLGLARDASGRRLRILLRRLRVPLDGLERLLERRLLLRDHLRRLRVGDDAARDERVRPLLAHGRQRRDDLVHRRLRERRLVALVVAVAAIPDEVDQRVALERRAIRRRQPRDLDAGLRVVRVHVEDRNLEAADQAARVGRRERLPRRGGEADLVVRDDVDRAADVVEPQPRQVQRLGDDALARKRGVAVDQDRQRDALVDDRGRRARRRRCTRRAPCRRRPGSRTRDGSGSAASR